MSDSQLIERTTRSVGERGQMRLVADHWRDVLDCADEIEYDLVELRDGAHEIRIRSK